MSSLTSRIERLEERITADEEGYLTLEDLYHYTMLYDPEEFRRKAMDPDCRDRRMMENALNTPVPKRVKRWFRKGLLEKRFSERENNSQQRETDAQAEKTA